MTGLIRASRSLYFALLVLCATTARAGELWLYYSQNLWVDKNIDAAEQLFARAAKAGYTHVLLSDSKFSKLDDMDARYFKNVERIKRICATNRLEIVPALFPIGYSNDILWHDPNLIEGLPVRDVELEVRNGIAQLPAAKEPLLKGGDFADLKQWSWHDDTVQQDTGGVVIRNTNGKLARIVQKINLKPWHRYHLSVRVKTAEFKGSPEVKVLTPDGTSLNWNFLGAKPTQDWTVHHVVFDSLQYTNANLYLGTWDPRSGELWFGDVKLEETIFVNLIRRPGAPLTVTESATRVLQEGVDYPPLSDPKMGRKMWPGSYDIYHEPPLLKVSGKIADGTKLKVSCYHAVTVHDDQANICPSEPKTLDLLRDQARRMHAAWGAKSYMMSHDEIRVYNWCAACQARKMTAGQMLADNVRQCTKILREVNPGGRIYVWSDMFDPNHNAHDNYYLVRGSYAGSWEGLDNDVSILPWYFEKRAESLKFFANRGHHQVIAGYYDSNPANIKKWLQAGSGLPGIDGVMYTTWAGNFSNIEAFAQAAREP